jgi:hypothetical protein
MKKIRVRVVSMIMSLMTQSETTVECRLISPLNLQLRIMFLGLLKLSFKEVVVA